MDEKTYINILTDTIVKKISVIDELINITQYQEEVFSAIPLDLEKIEESVSKKEILIENLNQLDSGFEKIFEHVQDELKQNRLTYKDQIIKLQHLINQVMEKSTKLEIMEKQNKNQFTISFLNKRKEIGEHKLSNKVASNYYKNMANQHQGQSYFLDKKK